ncbi:hypothetical protein [Armatimonas sp.]|uniref:hypothetical protein n=1 Tax=Armatimonas sp. TaxID=1872638 RepID=UPI00374DF679
MMYKSLMPEFLSVSASLPRATALAARHGFVGVDTSSGHPLAPRPKRGCHSRTDRRRNECGPRIR